MSSQQADEKGRGAEMGLWVLVDAFADPELKYTLVGPANLGEVLAARGTKETKGLRITPAGPGEWNVAQPDEDDDPALWAEFWLKYTCHGDQNLALATMEELDRKLSRSGEPQDRRYRKALHLLADSAREAGVLE